MFSAVLETSLNLLFPPLCRGCNDLLPGQVDTVLCVGCWEKMEPIRGPVCWHCGAPEAEPANYCRRCPGFITAFDSARFAVDYSPLVRELIHAFKFGGSLKVRPLLAELFLKGANLRLKPQDFDTIVPVPLHWTRLFKREFNQSELLADELAKQWGILLSRRALKRSRRTSPQSKLRGRWRTENIKDAFAPGREEVEGKRILLVDDVMTTGMTLSACAQTLREAGAAKVVAYTLARRLS